MTQTLTPTESVARLRGGEIAHLVTDPAQLKIYLKYSPRLDAFDYLLLNRHGAYCYRGLLDATDVKRQFDRDLLNVEWGGRDLWPSRVDYRAGGG